MTVRILSGEVRHRMTDQRPLSGLNVDTPAWAAIKARGRPTSKIEERQAVLNAESRAALDKSQQERATQKFGAPKQRRCQSCEGFFECTRIEDILCPECEGRRFEVRA